jgi:hypothetical protein
VTDIDTGYSALEHIVVREIEGWSGAEPHHALIDQIHDLEGRGRRVTSETVWHAVQRMAEDEVRIERWENVANIVSAGYQPVDALVLAVRQTHDLVLNGADDTASGRSGDLRRVRFDALRGWLNQQLMHLQSYGIEVWA